MPFPSLCKCLSRCRDELFMYDEWILSELYLNAKTQSNSKKRTHIHRQTDRQTDLQSQVTHTQSHKHTHTWALLVNLWYFTKVYSNALDLAAQSRHSAREGKNITIYFSEIDEVATPSAWPQPSPLKREGDWVVMREGEIAGENESLCGFGVATVVGGCGWWSGLVLDLKFPSGLMKYLLSLHSAGVWLCRSLPVWWEAARGWAGWSGECFRWGIYLQT